MEEEIVLVNSSGELTGTMEKLQAHIEGKLHRAFSVFIFNSKGELLLQRRALSKYHSGGKWSNTCCSHPRPGEDVKKAAQRRLAEEMGMICELEHIFSFIYRAELDKGLIEHEFDHVFVGVSDAEPIPVAEEVADFAYINLSKLEAELRLNPDKFTAWLKICFERLKVNLIAIKTYNE